MSLGRFTISDGAIFFYKITCREAHDWTLNNVYDALRADERIVVLVQEAPQNWQSSKKRWPALKTAPRYPPNLYDANLRYSTEKEVYTVQISHRGITEKMWAMTMAVTAARAEQPTCP